ncbi:MAG TPA: hypothetical protein VEL76_33045, partial [Gemmataceae bacterium]|nr:hypothetical protein [Gemmataceae bacterium]
ELQRRMARSLSEVTHMGFAVTHSNGTSDTAFQAYARLLRQKGIDLGKLPHTPAPRPSRGAGHPRRSGARLARGNRGGPT